MRIIQGHVIIILIVAILFSACKKHEEQETVPDEPTAWEHVIEKRDFYVANATDGIYVARCDNLTFKALMDAFGTHNDLFDMEWKDGEWHRDTSTCYPGNSKSEISRDGFIMLLHALRVREDGEALARIWDYGVEHNWVMGSGPWKLTNMLPLVPILEKMRGLEWAGDASIPINILPLDPPEAHKRYTKRDLLTGFRGHLLAMYIYLVGKVYGELNEVEFKALQMLRDENDANPIMLAVYHRFADGDQERAIEILANDVINPMEVTFETGVYGWGSCPKIVHYITAVGILEGM